MKLLLDENLPKKLKLDFPEHEIRTVREMDWNGLNDFTLLFRAKSEGFKMFLTFDKNIRYQQNFSNSAITVLILNAPNNTYSELTKLSPLIRRVLKNPKLPAGPMAIYIGMGA